MDFKRASVRPQKGIYCKSIGRLLEAKRPCVSFELHENNLQTLADAYKKDLQVASNKYLEEVGNAANPKTKFITTYSFDDSIIKDNKK